MFDQSNLDNKYFIDNLIYNCPFCNRRHVSYDIIATYQFDWNNNKTCYSFLVTCNSCRKKSLHHSFTRLETIIKGYHNTKNSNIPYFKFNYDGDLDEAIFHSIPSSYFVSNEHIPKIIRDLITEAESSLEMNFLTGASACARKSIYELLNLENVEGDDYTKKIKNLKEKYPNVEPQLFDTLAHIQDMTSDKVHEQSWDKWDSKNLRIILEVLKLVLDEIYVIPNLKKSRFNKILKLKEDISNSKKE